MDSTPPDPFEEYSDLKRPKVGFVHRIGPAPKLEWQMEMQKTDLEMKRWKQGST